MNAFNSTIGDSLDDLINGNAAPLPPRPLAPHTPASYKPQDFSEPCRKCRGTGAWRPGYPCFACKRCVEKRNAARLAAAQRVAAAPVVSLDKIEAAFSTARANGLKRLTLRLAGFTLAPASAHSANAGALYVRQDGTYLGKITGGKFVRARVCTAEQEVELVALTQDPKSAAIAYGKRTGSCSCCGRELTNAVSIEMGIGPICATKWGW